MALIKRVFALAITAASAAAGAAAVAYRCHSVGLRRGQVVGELIGRADGHTAGYREGKAAGYTQASRDLARESQITYLRGVVAGAIGGPPEMPLAS